MCIHVNTHTHIIIMLYICMYVVALTIDTSGTIVGVGIMRRRTGCIIIILGSSRLTSLFGSGVVSGVRLSVLLVTELEYFLCLLGCNTREELKNEYVHIIRK